MLFHPAASSFFSGLSSWFSSRYLLVLRLALTSFCSKLSSWRSWMGDGQAVGRLLSQPG